MKTATKKTIYAIKDYGNKYADESIVELHETKESAEISMESLESTRSRSKFWIEEMDLICLANAELTHPKPKP
jgi:hypothetical protein